MSRSPRTIWLWQEIVSPHMAGLAVALAARGCRTVYVAERMTSDVGDRASQGWAEYDLGAVELRLAPDPEAVRRLAREAPADSVHVCESIRGKGSRGQAQVELRRRHLRQWAIMERVKDAGWIGPAKRLAYRAWMMGARRHVQGVLAIGQGVPEWVAARGFPAERVFPFTYFLRHAEHAEEGDAPAGGRFRFVFAGRLVELKRVDLLIEAVARLPGEAAELEIIGTGPLERQLRDLGERLMPGRVIWRGRMSFDRVPLEIRKADCLVLPSRIDGWGAVVSEALMQGTPAICSDQCGASVAVRASAQGGVFESGSVDSLAGVALRQLNAGRMTRASRSALGQWATCLGSDAGAAYLLDILDHAEGRRPRPPAPWERPH
jgi:glycosyltransferase involved in cell wall biosynthesis